MRASRAPRLLLAAFLAAGCALAPPAPADTWKAHMAAGTETDLLAAQREAEKFPEKDARRARTLDALATLYYSREDYAKAEPYCLRALAAQEKAAGPDRADTSEAEKRLGDVYRLLHRDGEAQTHYERALTAVERARGKDHPDVVARLRDLALLDQARDRDQEAEAIYKRILAIQEKASGPDSAILTPTLQTLALFRQSRGDNRQAEEYFRRALAILEKTGDQNGTRLDAVLDDYAHLLRRMQRPEEAAPLEARAQSIRAARGKPSGSQ